MNCVSCGAPQPDPPPRFCDACGLAIPRVLGKKTEPHVSSLRCPECALPNTSRRCRGCGTLIRWPDDALPPDEEFGRPPAPHLELPDEGEDVPLDDDEGSH